MALILFPIIGIPFKRIGMDLVGLLLKSSWGQEYILMIDSYSTKDPKEIPLWKATSHNIAWKLVTLQLHGKPEGHPDQSRSAMCFLSHG